MKNKIESFLEKYFSLSVAIFVILIVCLISLIPGFEEFEMGLQLMLTIMVGLMSIISILLANSIQKKSRGSNMIIALCIFAVSVFGYFDLLNTERQYEYIDKEIVIEETSKMTLLHIDDYEISEPRYKILYDEENPLKLYHGYKLDRFNYKVGTSSYVKSDLMDDYVIIIRIKK